MPNPAFDPRYAAEFQPGFVAEDGDGSGSGSGSDFFATDGAADAPSAVPASRVASSSPVTTLSQRGQDTVASAASVPVRPRAAPERPLDESAQERSRTSTPPWRTAPPTATAAPPRRWSRNVWLWVLTAVGVGLLGVGMVAQLSALGTTTGMYTGESSFYDSENAASMFFLLQLSWALAPILIALGIATLIGVLFTIALSTFRVRSGGQQASHEAEVPADGNNPRGESVATTAGETQREGTGSATSAEPAAHE